MSKTPFILAAVSACAFAYPAAAQTAETDMNVTITITDECKSAVATDLAFGSNGILDANVDTTSDISFTCTTDLPFDVGLGAGGATGATTSTRGMTSAADNVVNYQLFLDSNRQENWGDVVSTDTLDGTGTGTEQSLTVYGRVPPQTTPPADSYSDTVHVTVTY